MIRDALSKLKAWLSPNVPSSTPKPVGKGKTQSTMPQARIAGAAKKMKRRAQRQARARNR